MQLFIRTGIAAYHGINKAYITSVLCENKNKPNVRCNGRCKLKRDLRAVEERERKASGSIREILELLVFSSASLSLPLSGKAAVIAPYGSVYYGRLITNCGDGVFHPPPVCVA